ncbi:MGT1 magnesium transporter [Leishmania donovani]|uniref:MGT1 magnesium transporter n=1 Tax=Leishmania donovani TaxID=5661 RepID=E9BCH2_LEIDO|nr:MGT1 magnesium transporter [Leishmania donovani]CBZ32948.1 MGT1 magnesium transporter [Leishmania donovani]
MSSNASTETPASLRAEEVTMTSPDRLTNLGTSTFLTPPSVEHPSAASELGSSHAPLPPRVQNLANVVVPLASAEARVSNAHSYARRPLEIVESIRGLHELHQKGGLTREEFAQAKQQILDSAASSASTYKSKSKRSRGRRHRRRGRRSRNSSRSASTSTCTRPSRDARSRATTGVDPRSASHRPSRSSSSSKSSSSSSSSSSNRFIIVPRSNVWRTLNDPIEEGLLGHHLTEGHHLRVAYNDAPRLVRSPLLSRGGAVVGFGSRERGGQEECCAGAHGRHGYQEVPSEDPLTSNLASGAAVPTPTLATAADTKDGPFASPSGSAIGAATAATGSSVARYATSATVPDGRGKAKYGAFLHRDDGARAGGPAPHIHAVLNKEDVVCIQYFNSRGGSGNHFRDVELHTSQLRDPIFVHKGQSQVIPAKPRTSVTKPGHDEPVMMAMPTRDSQVFQLAEMTLEERRAWEEMTTTHSSSSKSRRAKSSYFEQSFNWYWVDVTGRDASRQQYNATLRYLTNRFKLCESFLVDRDHTLVLPQVCESPIYAGQYLLNLRVATEKIAISDDSVMELTNRWIIVVDLKQHIVITLHRVDTHSMANLRSQWKRVIENSNVSFQEFLLKIIDDAIYTYHLSLDVHTALLEKCEAKLFVEKPAVTTPEVSGHYIDKRILHHFAGSSRSPFLRRLLDEQDRSPMNKGEMNSFLHHLHRRTSVQHRMINVTQAVLAKAFTKLRLCSREMAGQMCASCIEISDRALEVRDDAKTLLNLHISLQSFRTTELMAVLTRVTMLFTPVTFLAGVYGMNFQKNFPELTWDYGYAFFWTLCIILVIAMHVLFVREH